MTEPIRVTQVLDYFKEPWYIDWVCKVGKREAKRVSTVAMNIGTAVDETIKYGYTKIKGNQVEVSNCMTAFNKWKEVYKPKIIKPMERFYDNILGVDVTGEPDLLVDGIIVDIKCASKVSIKHWIQVNTYCAFKNSLLGCENEKVAILRLDKNTGSYEYIVKDYDMKLFGAWCGLLEAYRVLKGDGVDNG